MHLSLPTNWIRLASSRRTLKEENTMNEALEATIGRKARLATSKKQLVDAIFASFVEHAIDPTRVSLEDMKTAVVVACRSARERSPDCDSNCLA
jgi:hypothetical protein